MDAESPLISVAELAGWLADGRPTVVVDLRWYLGRPGDGHRAYVAGHLPGATFLDLDGDLADLAGFGAPGRHPLPTPAAFARRMSLAGIADGALVVGYDDVGGWVAARLWWMLDDLGFGRRAIAGERVGVLNGGIAAWRAAGHPLETGELAPPPAAGRLHLADRWSGVIDRETLKARLGAVTLLDARGAPRYRGEVEPVDPVAGHIPTALSAPIDGNLDAVGMLRSPDDLRARYGELGIVPGTDREVVVSCGSGTSAALHSLSMRAAGLPDPILYVGSYSDWSRSGEPVATGPEPGDPPA
jgi:thiosulfate/3-mercaptopyruvate sulfurtransferase